MNQAPCLRSMHCDDFAQELWTEIEKQRKACKTIIDSKNELIAHIKKALKAKDNEFTKLLKQQTEDIATMLTKMNEQVDSMSQACRCAVHYIPQIVAFVFASWPTDCSTCPWRYCTLRMQIRVLSQNTCANTSCAPLRLQVTCNKQYQQYQLLWPGVHWCRSELEAIEEAYMKGRETHLTQCQAEMTQMLEHIKERSRTSWSGIWPWLRAIRSSSLTCRCVGMYFIVVIHPCAMCGVRGLQRALAVFLDTCIDTKVLLFTLLPRGHDTMFSLQVELGRSTFGKALIHVCRSMTHKITTVSKCAWKSIARRWSSTWRPCLQPISSTSRNWTTTTACLWSVITRTQRRSTSRSARLLASGTCSPPSRLGTQLLLHTMPPLLDSWCAKGRHRSHFYRISTVAHCCRVCSVHGMPFYEMCAVA